MGPEPALSAPIPRALDAELFSAIVRIFVAEVSRHHVTRARGILTDVHSGAIACIQRFGSTLNLNPHLHLITVDGVYARPAATALDATPPLVFHALTPPSIAEVERVSAATCRRVVRLLQRRGLATDDPLILKDDITEHQRLADLTARQPSLFARVDAEGRVQRVRPQPRPPRAGEVRGFSVHAGVSAQAGDVERRRRIVRYCLRPPFAASQFHPTHDGWTRIERRAVGPSGLRTSLRLELESSRMPLGDVDSFHLVHVRRPEGASRRRC